MRIGSLEGVAGWGCLADICGSRWNFDRPIAWQMAVGPWRGHPPRKAADKQHRVLGRPNRPYAETTVTGDTARMVSVVPCDGRGPCTTVEKTKKTDDLVDRALALRAYDWHIACRAFILPARVRKDSQRLRSGGTTRLRREEGQVLYSLPTSQSGSEKMTQKWPSETRSQQAACTSTIHTRRGGPFASERSSFSRVKSASRMLPDRRTASPPLSTPRTYS